MSERYYSYIDPAVGIGSEILAGQDANGGQYGVLNSVDIVARNITATGNFIGDLASDGSTFVNLNVTGIATIAGNLSVGGTITYEDVTNVDSIGIITARSGIVATGVVTATSFDGTVTNATNLNNQAASYYLNYNNFTNTPTIPTNNNQLTNGAGYAPLVTSDYNGTYNIPIYTGGNLYPNPTAGGVTITGSSGQISTPSHGNSSQWNTAYGWGNHASAGYLTSFDITTQTDSKYLRSDTTDDFSGVLQGNNAGGTYFNLRGGGNGNTLLFRVSAADTNENISSNLSSDYGFNIRYRGDLNGVENAFQIDADNQTGSSIEALRIKQDGVTYFGPTPLVGSNTIWHAGNDGSGSGLDADTLDGLTSAQFVQNSSGLESNLDTYYVADMFGWSASTTGRPESYGQGIAIVSSGRTHNNSNNWITQLAFGTSTTGSYFRTKVNAGGWSSWHKLWNSGNDGSGSGLDADTVDGIQASSFLRSDADDTTTGTLTLSKNGAQLAFDRPDGDGQDWKFYQWASGLNIYPSTAASDVFFGRDGSTTNVDLWNGGLKVAGTTVLNNSRQLSNVTYGGNTIWHAGNDGSGSGLDADKVDGIQGASFLRSDADDNATGKITLNGSISPGSSAKLQINGFVRTGPIMLAQGTAGQSSYGTLDERWIMQDGSHVYVSTASNSYNNKIWTDANDGSGSGLDADTLDGVQASSFIRSDATDSFTGTLNGSASLAINSGGVFTPGAGNTSQGIVLRYTKVAYFSYDGVAAFFNRNSDGDLISLRRSGTEEGSIEIDTTRVYFRTSSDYRRKTNVTAITNGVSVIKALNPSSYNWIEDNRLDHGFLAHEIQEHIPGSASGYKDEVDEEGEPVYQKVDLTTVIPFLTAALKDSIARIETLEAEVSSLKEQISQ